MRPYPHRHLAARALWLLAATNVVVGQDRCSTDVPCKYNGTCDVITGYCACLLGYGGPLCETPLYPACAKTLGQSSRGFPPALRCFRSGAKSCECLRQCHDRPALKDTDQRFNCFERVGVPPEQQISDAPADDEPAKFYRDAWSGEEIPREEYSNGSPSSKPVSSRLCPLGCSDEGECLQESGRPSPECRCYHPFYGAGCEHYNPAGYCVNDCRNRGECIRGFCSCSPGFSGIDCSVEALYNADLPGPGGPNVMADPPRGHLHEGPPARPHRPVSPEALKLDPSRYHRGHARIFVVELPPWMALTHMLDRPPGGGLGRDTNYMAPEIFLSRVLRDTAVRSHDPYEANLFLVPDFNIFYSDNGSPPHDNVRRIVKYLKANYAPFWERNQGADFMFSAAGDPGACPIPEDLLGVLWLTHLPLTNHSKLRWDIPESVNQTCFIPGHGVALVPNLLGAADMHLRSYSREQAKPRKWLFYFAGTMMFEHPMYSQGVRQAVYKHYANETDFGVFNFGSHPLEEMLEAKFCLCPLGSGWGMRLVQVVAYGCLPVIIQDDVVQPGEDVLPYEQFSVRVSKADIPLLGERLRAIGDAELTRMQAALRRVHWYFCWDEQGGGAYDLVLQSLTRVLHHKIRKEGQGSSVLSLANFIAQKKLRR